MIILCIIRHVNFYLAYISNELNTSEILNTSGSESLFLGRGINRHKKELQQVAPGKVIGCIYCI